jgi:hypothetical protein
MPIPRIEISQWLMAFFSNGGDSSIGTASNRIISIAMPTQDEEKRLKVVREKNLTSKKCEEEQMLGPN